MAKRKREVSPTSSAQSSPAPSSSKPAEASRTHKRQKGGEEPKIVYQLADGSKRLERRLSRDKTLVDALYKVTKKSRITTPGSIRLSQVRQGGREVEIYDEFDYKAFKERAKASSEDEIIVTVYPGSRPGEAPSSPISSFSTPSSHAGPSSRPDSPSTPRSILSTSSRAGPSTPTTQNKQKGKKRVSILEPHSTTPKTPEQGRVKPSPSRASSKGKGKSVDPMVSTAPDVATNNLNVPEGVSITPNVLRSLNKYKPAQPSPSSKPTRMDSDTSDSESPVKSTTGQNNQTPPKKRVRLRRNRKSLPSSEADPTGQPPAAQSPVVVDAPGGDKTVAHVSPEGSSSSQLSRSTPPSHTASAPTAPTSTPSASELAGQEPSSSPSAPLAEVSMTPEEDQSTSAQTPQRRRKAKETQSISTEVAGSSTMSPSLEPAMEAAPSSVPSGDAPEATSTADAVLEGSSATAAPSRSKVVISMASPWNLFDKPAEPSQTGDYSSSSIDSPKRGKKGRKSKRDSLAANDVAQESDVSTHQASPTAELSVAGVSNAEHVTATDPAISPSEEVNAPEKEQPSSSTPHDTASISEPSAITQTIQTSSTPAPATPGSNADGPTTNPVTAKKAKKAAKAPTSSIAKDIMAAYRAKQAADLAKEQAAAASVESTPVPVESVTVPSPELPVAVAQSTTDAPTASIEVTIPEQQNAINAVDAAGPSSPTTAAAAEDAANGSASTPILDVQPSVSLEHASADKTSGSVETSTTAQTVGEGPSFDSAPNGVAAEGRGNDLATPRSEATASRTLIETSPANTKLKGARPLTLWSQPIEGMTRGGREENAIIASRAACIICLSTADHLQKDCPEVKQGRESLESLLQVRRDQVQAEKEEVAKRAALRKTQKGRKTMEDNEDTFGMTTESVETIEKWIERSKRLDAVKERVTNGRQETSPQVASYPIAEHRLTSTPSKITKDHSSPSVSGPNAASGVEAASSPTQSPERFTTGTDSVGPSSLPASSQTFGDQSSPSEANITNSFAHSNGEEIPVPLLQTPTEEEAMSSFPLHQLALQRMNKKKRPGSLSGLSASDAVIETGDSDTDSSDSDSMSMTRSPIGSILGRMDDTDSGSDFDSIDSEDESGPGAVSDPSDAHETEQEDGEDGDNEDSGPSSRSPSVSDSGSESGSSGSRSRSSSSSSSRSSSPSSDSLADDPEASFRHFFSQPLSAKEKKRARLSAASATPSQTLDIEMEIEEPPYIEDIEEDETPIPSQARGRRGSDSSIDVGHADEDEDKMDVDDEISPASLTHPPTFVHSDIETEETVSEADPAETRRNSRSFVDLAREAGPSPTVDDFEGAIASKEAIAEEEMPQVLVEETIEDKRPRHVVSQGLPSPPSSQEEDIVATQSKDESTPRTSRGGSGRGRVPSSLPMESSQESQASSSQMSQPTSATQPAQPTQTLRRSTRGTASTPTSPVQASRQVSNGQAGSEGIRRRLRSASREVPDVVVAPRLTRRSAAASQDPTSPVAPSSSLPNGTPKGRRKASITASPEVNRRMTRSRSQITPDRPSINTAPPSSSVNGSQLELIEEQETPKAVKFGSVNATPVSQLDERESSAAIPEDAGSDSGTDANTPMGKEQTASTQRSPLFMSQGSQPLATQHYTLVDSSLPSEPLNRNSSRTELRTTSPIVEENEDNESQPEGGDGDDADDAESRQSSSDEDNDIPLMRPIQTIRRTASQGPPALSMPTSSSLDTSLLRARTARVTGRTGMSASQPTPKTNKMGMRVAESESEVSSSSDEDEVPPERRGRYATGRKTKEKAKTNGVMRGW